MMDEYMTELRRIRITLVVMTIVLLFFSGKNVHVNVDHNHDTMQPSQVNYYRNVIPLENGDFGILSGDSAWETGGTLEIYHYDVNTNNIIRKKQISIEELKLENEL